METINQEAYWREKIAESRTSPLTMRDWCAAQDITLGRMKYWIRKLGVSTRRKRVTAAPETMSPTWVTLQPTEPPQPSNDTVLVVRIGAVAVDVRPGFDAALLAQVVRALEASD